MLQQFAIQKNVEYPTISSKEPAIKPGIIIDKAMKAVQIA